MKKLLYIKANLERVPKLRIVTKIIQKNKNILVCKKSFDNLSLKHLKKIRNNEIIWQRYIKNIGKVLKSKIKGDHLYYKYIKKDTLDKKISNALLAKDFNKATLYFKKGIDLINKIPNFKIKTHPKINDYLSIFGLKPNLKCAFFKTSNIDITSENLIFSKKTIYFLDCEWVFDFPIEKDYIIFRYLISILPKNQPLFSTFKSLIFSEYGYKGFYIPDSWLQYSYPTKASKKRIIYFSKKEKHFQNYVLGNYPNTEPVKINKNINQTFYNIFEKVQSIETKNSNLIKENNELVQKDATRCNTNILPKFNHYLTQKIKKLINRFRSNRW